MKILTAIFTCNKNIPYLETCLRYYRKAEREILGKSPSSWNTDLAIIDFSDNEVGELWKLPSQFYSWKPGAGFCQNFNTAETLAFFGGYTYLMNINDDAFISPQFMIEGIQILESNRKAGMVAGIPNKGGWQLPLDAVSMPDSTCDFLEVNPLDRLWWEASAAIYRVRALEETGKWDVFFDKAGGVCSDNDFYWRMQQQGWKLYRSGSMRFFHCKGITQGRMRVPIPGHPDPLKKRNQDYFFKKWGVRLESGETPRPYKTEFNLGVK
jgi:hypothetical protein